MPEYRITIYLKIGEKKSALLSPRGMSWGVKNNFEKKLYESYSKYLVEKIIVERIDLEKEE